jgi:hypothetical protein
MTDNMPDNMPAQDPSNPTTTVPETIAATMPVKHGALLIGVGSLAALCAIAALIITLVGGSNSSAATNITPAKVAATHAMGIVNGIEADTELCYQQFASLVSNDPNIMDGNIDDPYVQAHFPTACVGLPDADLYQVESRLIANVLNGTLTYTH